MRSTALCGRPGKLQESEELCCGGSTSCRHAAVSVGQLAAELGGVLAGAGAWDAAALLLHKCAAALPWGGAGGAAELQNVSAELAQAVDTPDLPVWPPC